MILQAIKPAFQALQYGQALSNIAAWKNSQAVLNLLVSLAAIASAVGYISPKTQTLSDIASGIAASVSVYLTYATSTQVGLTSDDHSEIDPITDDINQLRRLEPINTPPNKSPVSSPRADGPDLP